MKLSFTDNKQQIIEYNDDQTLTWRIAAYGLIKNARDEYLMVKPSFDPLWQFPGGEVDIKESVETGLIREVGEETGYIVSITNNQPVFMREGGFYSGSHKFHHSIQLFFESRLSEENRNPELMLEEDQGGIVEWKKIDDLTQASCQLTHWPLIQFLQSA